MNMDFAGDLESLEQDTTNTLFNEDFSKHKEYIKQAAVKFEKWEERLQERERKIEEKEKEIEIVQEDFLKLCERVEYLEEKEKETAKCCRAELKEHTESAEGVNGKDSKIIHLNVGGWRFTTSLSTLRSEQGSVLEKMFSGKFDVKKERDGSVFIDRNGEHFNYILNFLRGDICGIRDFSFDENTRKSLIKEAEFYQLDRMKKILAFKSTTLAPVDDGKEEVINIIERVIYNKEALEDFFKDRDCTRRKLKEMQVSDLRLTENCGDKRRRTNREQIFEYSHWDHLEIENVIFIHDTCFKNCSFLGATFRGCKLGYAKIVFHKCDLIFADFRGAILDDRRVVDFDGSDLRAANFKGIEGMGRAITNGSVKITNAKHIEKAVFDDDALRAIIGRVETFLM